MNDDSRDPRIYLAAERTFLAWIRTGLALMALGFLLARVAVLLRVGTAAPNALADDRSSLWPGIVLIVGGMGTCIAAAFRNTRYIRAIDRGAFRAAFGSGLGAGVVMLITLVGGAILLGLAW